MSSQINLTKQTNHESPPSNMLGYGFDNIGRPVRINTDGSHTLLGLNSESIPNIIANTGVGLEFGLPSSPSVGDVYVTTDTLKKYTRIDSVTWSSIDLIETQFIVDNVDSDYPLLYVFNGVGLELLTTPREYTDILTITDANVGTYIGTGTGSSEQYLINVPIKTTIVSFETTSFQKIYGVQFASTPSNGKKVSLVGLVEYACSVSETATGRFSLYLYGYLAGTAGGTQTKAVDAFIEFMAWNGKMYSDGY